VRLMAQRRKMAAARLAEGGVRQLSRRPPEILLFGAKVSQEAKCFSVGQRRMSVPISAMSGSAAWSDAVDLTEVGASVGRCSGLRISNWG
jgi:hypothetical protein